MVRLDYWTNSFLFLTWLTQTQTSSLSTFTKRNIWMCVLDAAPYMTTIYLLTFIFWVLSQNKCSNEMFYCLFPLWVSLSLNSWQKFEFIPSFLEARVENPGKQLGHWSRSVVQYCYQTEDSYSFLERKNSWKSATTPQQLFPVRKKREEKKEKDESDYLFVDCLLGSYTCSRPCWGMVWMTINKIIVGLYFYLYYCF